MCNRVHRDDTFQTIPESGTGYKFFFKNGRSAYRYAKYSKYTKGWIRWIEDSDMPDSGFTFFLDNSFIPTYVLRVLAHDMLDVELWKIEYEEGLGSWEEILLCGCVGGEAPRIAGCKKFRKLNKLWTTDID